MNQKETLGWTLFTFGFLIAAATAMKIPPMWSAFGPAIVMACGGALIARSGATGGSGDTDEDAVFDEKLNPVTLAKSMIKELSRIEEHIKPSTAQEVIEGLQAGEIATFVDQRKVYMTEYGPESFANFFGSFAKAERNVNRAWSALIDEHPPEMHKSVDRAIRALGEVINFFEK